MVRSHTSAVERDENISQATAVVLESAMPFGTFSRCLEHHFAVTVPKQTATAESVVAIIVCFAYDTASHRHHCHHRPASRCGSIRHHREGSWCRHLRHGSKQQLCSNTNGTVRAKNLKQNATEVNRWSILFSIICFMIFDTMFVHMSRAHVTFLGASG